MTTMDMVWVATANLLHPNTVATFTVTKSQIEAEVGTLYGEEYRLYKRTDTPTDAWEKTGPTRPDRTKIDQQFVRLIDWYGSSYY